MLYPVAHIVQFEKVNKSGKADAELLHGQWIELLQTICRSHHEKRWLGNLCPFEGRRQIEIRLGSTIVVEGAMKARALEFSYVVFHVVCLSPGG